VARGDVAGLIEGTANNRRSSMAVLTKKEQQELFIEELLRRLREAPPGERVYMRVGDLFKDADVHSLDEWRSTANGDLPCGSRVSSRKR
jgi:hypothetical protein